MLFKSKGAAKGSFDLSRDEDFVEACYRVILDRKSDPGGKEHYHTSLASGAMSRTDVVRSMVLSEECRNRFLFKYPPYEVLFDYVDVADPAPFASYVEDPPYTEATLCELTNPRRWLEEEWFNLLRDLKAVPLGLEYMHRKGFEWTQTIYGLKKLGFLNDDTKCLGVGSGHEALVYWLANNTGQVIATDLYEGAWVSKGGKEGDPGVLEDPARYAPFEYRRDRLTFQRMNGCDLEFADNSFDVTFSISSIEHFGSHDNSAKSMAEMGRVLRPGGVCALVTEMIVNDKPHKEFFRPHELLEYVVAPSGLKLIQLPEFKLPRYALEHPSRVPQETMLTPHLVLSKRGVVFTSVIFFLRKPA